MTDPRLTAWRAKHPASIPSEADRQVLERLATIFIEGQQTEVWQALVEHVRAMIAATEARFVTHLAPSYDQYVALFHRRQALTELLAIPETLKAKAGMVQKGQP